MVTKGELEPQRVPPYPSLKKFVPSLRVSDANWIRVLYEPPDEYTDGNARSEPSSTRAFR
jgi:hypothetical protein